jgi:hypothetical protein
MEQLNTLHKIEETKSTPSSPTQHASTRYERTLELKCKAIQHATQKLSSKKCTPSAPLQRLKCTLDQVRNILSVSTVFPAEFSTTSRDSLQPHKYDSRILELNSSKRLNRAYIIEHTKCIPSTPLPHASTRYERNLEAKVRNDSTSYNTRIEHTKCT